MSDLSGSRDDGSRNEPPGERPAGQLLRRSRDLLAKHLGDMVAPAVETTRNALLDAAEKARSTELQGRLVAAFNLLRRHEGDFGRYLRDAVDDSFRACFGDAAVPHEGRRSGEAELELVAQDVLEEKLAIDHMVHRIELRFTRELHAIQRRLTVVNRGHPVTDELNPLGPIQIGRVLQRAAGAFPIEAAHKVRLLGSLEQLVLARIGTLYGEVNAMFVEAGILPNIRFEIERRAGDRSPTEGHGEEKETTPVDQRPPRRARRDPIGSSVQRADELTREVRAESQALMSQIEALLDRMHAGRPEPPPERVVAPEDLGVALRDLQRQYLPERGEKLDADAIKARLTKVLALKGKTIAPQQEKTIDLMGMVYDYLRDELAVIDQVKNLFEQLQLPLLRVAMQDGEFFNRPDHPAREFFNTLSEAGDLWLGDQPENSEMLERLQTAVEDVAATDGDDVERFQERLEEIRRQIALSARKAQLAERRQVQARKGQEKLRIARAQAEEITRKLVEKFEPPAFARSLIEEAWADYLALLHLRHGDDSNEWQRAVTVIRFIALGLRGRFSGAQAEQLRERLPVMLQHLDTGLCQVGFTGEEADEATERVREAILWALDASAEERPPELDEPIPTAAARPRPAPAETGATVAKLEAGLAPGERQQLARLRLAAFGTWFEIAGDEPNRWIKRKLSWFSPVTGRCLLTDSQGRGEEMTLVDLAKKMHAGTARRFEPPRKPLLDRALEAVMGRLRRLAGQVSGGTA